jgi:hypothetical protein
MSWAVGPSHFLHFARNHPVTATPTLSYLWSIFSVRQQSSRTKTSSDSSQTTISSITLLSQPFSFR